MKNFIARGDVLTLPTAAAVASGAGVLIGSIFGVAANDAAAGEEVVLNVVGLFELPKTESQAWTAGDAVYWDDAASEATTVATGNTLIGVATAAVAGGATDTIGKVRLNGTFGHPVDAGGA